MGYQLWTSPITGYRRRGTRLSEYRGLLGKAVTVNAIFEPLLSCPSNADAGAMRVELERRDFDVAGVMEDREGPVIGSVATIELTSRRVSDHIVDIPPDYIVDTSLSISDLLPMLMRLPHVFVRVGEQVGGIVTRTDLNKPPVRVYLFGLISLLEMHLGFWVGSTYPAESWQQLLKDVRVEAARTEQRKQHIEGLEAGLLDCTQFCDKRDLLLKSSELRDKLGIGSKTRAETVLVRVERLRNKLAHSQQNISAGAAWNSLIEVVEWIERFLTTSDELVERAAAASAETGTVQLWPAQLDYRF
nr:hypothetical protein [Luteibacter rhizovicinus]